MQSDNRRFNTHTASQITTAWQKENNCKTRQHIVEQFQLREK